MNHADHVYLLEGDPGLRARLNLALRGAGGTWADFGSGSGAFTLALADLLSPGARIYSVDRDAGRLREQAAAMQKAFPGTAVEYMTANFTHPLHLPALDGIVMANSLHFIPDRDKPALLARLRGLLKPGGQFILVEYNAAQGNVWVPYPLTLEKWRKMAQMSGFTQTSRLGARPSHFLGEIFSAVSVAGDTDATDLAADAG